MRKKDLVLYIVVLLLVVLFLWQWLSKGALISQTAQLQKYNYQLQLLSGIGQLGSVHHHADVKVYINGISIDFSQRKYQLTTSFIHFEEGLGDVIHLHAPGLTIGHLLNSVGIKFNSDCLFIEGQSYCNDKDKKIKFYVNDQPNKEFYNYVIKDLDKILISYGNENDLEIKKQLDSITNLAPKYSAAG